VSLQTISNINKFKKEFRDISLDTYGEHQKEIRNCRRGMNLWTRPSLVLISFPLKFVIPALSLDSSQEEKLVGLLSSCTIRTKVLSCLLTFFPFLSPLPSFSFFKLLLCLLPKLSLTYFPTFKFQVAKVSCNYSLK
jgi:hypothetical protein